MLTVIRCLHSSPMAKSFRRKTVVVVENDYSFVLPDIAVAGPASLKVADPSWRIAW
jgi:hypothetical protein